MYVENEQSLILFLKNIVKERNVKLIIPATIGGNNGGDFGENYCPNETAVINATKTNNKVTAQQTSDSTGIPKRTIERTLILLRDKGFLVREGTNNGKRVIKEEFREKTTGNYKLVSLITWVTKGLFVFLCLWKE